MNSQPNLVPLNPAIAIQTDTKIKTVQTEKRIDIIDVVRGIAILGVLLVSINIFGRPESYWLNFKLANEGEGVNYYLWWVINGFFSGSMRALFSMLFGTSTILLLYRLEKRENPISPADIYYRRMLVLLAFAFFDSFILLWSSDILYSYAICGLFLFPFRHLKPKFLVIISIVLLMLPTVKDSYMMYKVRELRTKGELAIKKEQQGKPLSEEQLKDKKTLEDYRSSIQNREEEARQEKNTMLQGYFSIAKRNFKQSVVAQGEYFYATGFLDVMPFFFMGMALFKLGILTGERSRRFYWIMALTGIGLGSLVAYYMLTGYIKSGFDSSYYADYMVADLYQARRVFLALGYIGLIMLFYKYNLAKGLFKIVAKVGQMSLTNYIMQAAICAVIFYGFGFKLYGSLERYELYYVVLGVWIFQIVFSNIWMTNYRYGPLEWAWRCLTYWQVQPNRRKK